MEEALKVSIGGVSFIINKEGFSRLDSYLRGIEKYYANRPGGKEIVDDIESRIAELLLEKHTKEDVVTLERVEKVIDLMGSPNQFEDSQEEDNRGGNDAGGFASGQAAVNVQPTKKRLYRDPSDRMIGGVCSGLAHYFKFDPSVLRIILAVILAFQFIGRGFFHLHGFFGYHVIPSLFSFCVVGYIILWIVVPSAKTYSQKCLMSGADPGIRGAEENYANQTRPAGWWLGRLIKVLLGLFFIFIGRCGFAFAEALLIGSLSLFGVNPVNALSFLQMSPWLRILMKVTFVLSVIIPCLVFLYLGIRWLFNLKRPKYRPGLIMFLVWLVAIVTGSILAGSSSELWPGSGGRYSYVSKEFPKHYDTLYVKYAALPESLDGEALKWEKMRDRFSRMGNQKAGLYVSWNGNRLDKDDDSENSSYVVDSEDYYDREYYLFVSKGRNLKTAYAIYPRLEIDHKSSSTIVDDSTAAADALKVVRDTTIKAEMEISVGRISFLDRWKVFEDKSENAQALVEIKDSLITLHPVVVTKKNKFDGTYVSTRLCIPDSSVVVISNPE